MDVKEDTNNYVPSRCNLILLCKVIYFIFKYKNIYSLRVSQYYLY
jgi:hypothetical protein